MGSGDNDGSLRASLVFDGDTAVAEDVGHQLAGGGGGGSPLDLETRTKFEGAYGVDLGNVRLHTGPEAAAMSESIQAEAFTHGSDVYFGPGRFQPGTPAGQHLLAHELAHVATESAGMAGENGIARKASADLVRRWPWGKKRRAKKQKRAVERGGRAAIAEQVAGGDDKSDTSAYEDIQTRFKAQLDFEQQKVAEHKAAGKNDEEAEELAYADAWEDDTVDPDLKKLAPMRKTRSEKHARKVDALTATMGARNARDEQVDAAAASGTIVHKPIAKLIDKIETMTAEMAESAIKRKTDHESAKDGGEDFKLKDADRDRYYEKARSVATKRVLAKSDDKKWVGKYEALPKSIKDEAHDRSRKRIAALKLLGEDRSAQTGIAADHKAEGKSVSEKMGYVKKGNMVQSGLAKGSSSIIKQANKDAGRDTYSKALKGDVTVTSQTTFSPEERAQGMLGEVSNGLKAVGGMVTGVHDFIKHIQLATTAGSAEQDPGAIIALITEGISNLQKPFAAAKAGMAAAKAFSGDQWLKVADKIPVMDIVSSSLGIVSDVVDLAGAVMQWASNRKGIAAAKRDGRSELIEAILRLKMRSATFIGKAIKHLMDNALSLGSTIATIASGGLAAPAKAAIKAVGYISSGGEFLFDRAQHEAIARKTGASRKHYTERLTGSAEERFRNDAKVSVGGLVVAATGSDDEAKKIARDVLSQYGSFNFDDANFDARFVINQVLSRMTDQPDPETHIDMLRGALKTVKHKRREVLDTYHDAKQTRDVRNAKAVGGKKNRGPFYVLGQVLKNVSDRRRIERKMAQTNMAYDGQLEGTRAKRVRARDEADQKQLADMNIGGPQGGMKPSMAIIDGKVYDLNDPAAVDVIIDAVEKAKPMDVQKEVVRLRALNAGNAPMLDLLDKMVDAAMWQLAVA